jgi:predicted AlkP superfamily phosphohydrolase/phosphomutase
MTRTLFIGLDGATFTVIDWLTDERAPGGAVMPCLARLMANGVRAKLRSTPNPLTPPAWVSIMTGRSPGHHGVFDFVRTDERDDEVFFTLCDARDVRVETIWSIASRQDRRIVSLNFPVTAPPRPVNGALVPGFVPWRHVRRNVTPPALFDRLKAVPGFDAKQLAWDFEKESQAGMELSAEDTENWVQYHVGREQQWFQIAEKLLAEDRPDIMAVMFDGTDKIQHQAWPFLDPSTKDEDGSEFAGRMRAHCHKYFRELDGYIQRLVALAGPQTQVFFASDHGFAASTEVVRINTILHDLGYLAWHPPDDSASGKRRERAWFANLDWRKTVAYCRTPSSNGINIRIAKRPGEPGVSPETYEPFRDRLLHQLRDLRDEKTGRPVFREVLKREDVFPGPAMGDAPDLVLGLWDYGFVSIRDGRPVVAQRAVAVGTHHPDGIFIASGAGIRPGTTAELLHVTDVAATLLYSLDLPIPADFEGRVAECVFTTDELERRPIRIGSPTLPVKDGEVQDGQIPDDEKEKIIKQLQMLGYME